MTDKIHVTSNATTVWDIYDYAQMNNTAEQPGGAPSGSNFIQNGKNDDGESQEYNLGAPATSGYVSVAKMWMYAYVGVSTVQSDWPVNIKLGGSWQTAKSLNSFSVSTGYTWTSASWTGLNISTTGLNAVIRVQCAPAIDKDEFITIRAMYLELTIGAGGDTTNRKRRGLLLRFLE